MPKKPSRTVTKAARFTPEEWGAVDAKLAGRDFSAACRALFLDQPIPERQSFRPKVEIERRAMSAYEAAKIRQLAAWGSNLNQIAKWTNTTRGRIEILGALLALERTMRRASDDTPMDA
jgi:hypothetical protein